MFLLTAPCPVFVQSEPSEFIVVIATPLPLSMLRDTLCAADGSASERLNTMRRGGGQWVTGGGL